MKSKTFLMLAFSCVSGWCLVHAGMPDDRPPDVSKTDSLEQQIAEASRRTIRESTKRIGIDPADVNSWSRRGDAFFFVGKFDKAVYDYERMVDLDASLDHSHWRLGIAYFYAGRFNDAAGQFERYHSFDDVDRENGIWRYFSQYKAYGAKRAQEGLLKYKKDDREPFPSVYKLFDGRATPKHVLVQINDSNLSSTEREKQLFYANLYIGLNEAINGRVEKAQRHLQLSTDNTWGPKAGFGPHYMWQVGRLHLKKLKASAE